MPYIDNNRAGWLAYDIDNFTAGVRIHEDFMVEEYIKEKKTLKKVLPKCYTCKQIMRNKEYSVLNEYGKIKICSNCKHIYDTFLYYFLEKKRNVLNNIFNFVFDGSSNNEEYVIKKLQRTNRNGIFIKPSLIIKDYWTTENGKSYLYDRMVKKCCKFCEKQFIKNYTLIKRPNFNEIRICRDCEHTLKIMLEEKRRGKEGTIRTIYTILAHRGTENKKL